MTIAIKLDRPALRQLIDSDPDFKLELQRSVLSEVTRNLFQKDIRTILEVGDKAFLKQVVEAAVEDATIMDAVKKQFTALVSRPTNYGGRLTLSAAMQAAVDEAVVDGRAKIATTVASEIARQTIDTVEASKADMDARIAARVNRLTAEYIDAESTRQFNARIENLKRGLAEA